MMYLLLFAGLFMGWSLGTNDAANAFGTAVATRVIKYRTAVTIIAALVIVGAFTGGANNIDKVAELATSNKVTATIAEVEQAIEEGEEEKIRFCSALKAAIIFTCAGMDFFAHGRRPVNLSGCSCDKKLFPVLIRKERNI